MHNPNSKLKNALFLCALFVFSSASFAAEEYYTWHDENGVKHYGSTPPQGVEAKKVKIYAGKGKPASAPQSTTSSDGAAGETPEEAKAKRELQKAQKAECDQERKRLSNLSSNSTVRMKQPDGTIKYLSKEEIAKEVKRSKDYLRDVCN